MQFNPTHGKHGAAPSRPAITAGNGQGASSGRPGFSCAYWPECGCYGAAQRPECPSNNKSIEDDGFVTIHPPLGEFAK
jgi:hypothetical protein